MPHKIVLSDAAIEFLRSMDEKSKSICKKNLEKLSSPYPGKGIGDKEKIVVAGEVKAVERLTELAKEKGAKRSMILPVSAPFHCKMLKPAGDKLKVELENIHISEMKIPVISNVTGNVITNSSEVKELLVRQVSSPVRWEDCVNKMIELGVDTFIEIGPGKVLSGFVKKISKEVTVLNVEDMASLNNVFAVLNK